MRANRILTVVVLVSLILFGGLLMGCNKSKQTGSMVVKMTDAPGDFQQVNVEVLRVEIHTEADGWVVLPTNAGVYNLLDLQNDVSVIIAEEGALPVGMVTQLRLILGTNNSIMVDDIVYGLALNSQDRTGLKINIDTEIMANSTLMLLLDFDAHESVVVQGDGVFRLKPVIKLESIIYL